MQLRKLYRTIETIAAQKFEKEEELIRKVLQKVVTNEEIDIKGGRCWKFDSKSGTYELLLQVGDMEQIKQHYRLKMKDYPLFLELPKLRTVIASEQNKYLRERGILKYSATGIGDKIQWRGKTLYKYVLAFNADHLDESLSSTLNIISAALSSAMRSRRIEKKAELLERDLDKAREIQRSILPQHEIRFQKYEIYGASIADRVVGGDFFDYLTLDGETERLGVVIGDAANKGLSAAAEALYVSGALRMGYAYQTKISSLLARLNQLLNRTFSEEHFVTLFYAEVTDDKNGLVIYANCGHNNPMLLRAHNDSVEYLEATGQILGPFPNETFKTDSVLMKEGDVLLLYTDGISEATNEQGEFFGEDRVAQILYDCRTQPSKFITQRLLEEVQRFNSMGTQSDDKTIVTIKRMNSR